MTLSVVGWDMNGGHYRNGVRYPGSTILRLSNGTSIYYSEIVSIAEALKDCREFKAIDTTEAQERLDHWVKTGEGVTFKLR